LLNSRPSFCCRWGDGRGRGERANRRSISGSATRIRGRGDLTAAQGLSRDARGVTLFPGVFLRMVPLLLSRDSLFFSFVAIRSIRAKPTAAIFSRFDRCSVFAGFTLTLENKWTCGQRINGGKRVHQRNINDNATFLFTIPIHENKSETSKIDIDICK